MIANYGDVIVRLATLKDAVDLAPRLRSADVRELAALDPKATPKTALVLSVGASTDCYAIEKTGVVIALFGAAPVEGSPQAGIVWMVSSDDLKTISILFLRHCKKHCQSLFANYRLLGNIVDSRNEVHVRWLKWLDFRFIRQVPLPSGETFLEFCKLADD